MPQKIVDLTGRTFGRLTVLRRCGGKGTFRWQCVCTCGNTSEVTGIALKNGYTKSCGCLRRETSKRQAQARARRGGAKSGANILADAAWRQGVAPASRNAYVPVKQWRGAEDALGDLAAVWARVWLPRLEAMPVVDARSYVSPEPWE